MQPKDTTRILPPDNRLKQKLSPARSLDDLITPQAVDAAQKKAQDTMALFIKETEQDLHALEHVYSNDLSSGRAGPNAIERLLTASFSIKSRAGTYGYELASAIAKSLHNFMEEKTAVSANDLIVIDAHIRALRAIFTNNVVHDGGETGMELLQSLENLTKKYK